MAFGSLAPGFQWMQTPQLQDNSVGTTGMNILTRLMQNKGMPPQGAGVGLLSKPGQPLSLAPPVDLNSAPNAMQRRLVPPGTTEDMPPDQQIVR